MNMGTTRGGFVRGSCIGKGSFGTVSLALDDSDVDALRPFAVKSVELNSCSHPDSLRSLDNEITILRSLVSPYVVAYLGDSTTEESSATLRNLHMEYLPGGTLADLARTSHLSEPDIRAYARCVALALRYLHSVAGVVHSDVKGRNVLVGPVPGSAKLADFGSARRIGAETTGQFVGGTPLWMAPEVARGEPATLESDIWSLGCTVIEMATEGGQPWQSTHTEDQEYRCMFLIGYGTGVPEFPSWMSKLGWDFLDKCLRRNAGERWTAEQLLQHPFLADQDVVTAAAEDHVGTDVLRYSPRSVLDWGNSEFDSVEEDEQVVNNGRERVRELACDRGMIRWESDDDDDDDDDDEWEVVRSSCTSSSSSSATSTSGSSYCGCIQPSLGWQRQYGRSSRLRVSMWRSSGWCKFLTQLGLLNADFLFVVLFCFSSIF